MSGNKDAAVSLHAPSAPSPERPKGRHWDPWLWVGYGAGTGIVTSAAGAAVSSRLSGAPRISMWIGVTTILAIGAIWLAEPAVNLLARWVRYAETRSLGVGR